MKHVIAVSILVPIMFAAGCGEKQQLKVVYASDPPGGTLYKQDGELLGWCPKVLWYDLDEEAIEKGFLDAKGLMVRWPTGPEKRSQDVIRIKVDGTCRRVVFTQPKMATEDGESANLMSSAQR
jgi:hypothetical protein